MCLVKRCLVPTYLAQNHRQVAVIFFENYLGQNSLKSGFCPKLMENIFPNVVQNPLILQLLYYHSMHLSMLDVHLHYNREPEVYIFHME